MALNPLKFRNNLASADTTRKRSDIIWSRSRRAEILEDPNVGIYLYDDFSDLPLAPTLTTQIAYGKYKAFAASGCTLTKVSPVNSVEIPGGALAASIDTDNDSVSLADAYPSFRMSGDKNTSGLLMFECCIAQKSVATNMASSFIGLAEVELQTLAIALPLNAGNSPTADGAMIGFRLEEDGLGVVDTVYADRATSFTNIGDTEGGTLVAYTFRKLGFVYDPNETDNCVTFYANGVPLATRLSRSALVALTHLDANALGRLMVTCADSAGTAHDFYMKWWACEQHFPVGT